MIKYYMDLFEAYEANTEILAVEYDGGSDLGLFETYGEDLNTVLDVSRKYPQRVWTLIDSNEETIWVNGLRTINAILYGVTCEDGSSEESFVLSAD